MKNNNKSIPSLDTGLLAMGYIPMIGSVLDNGNYELLNITSNDKLLCSCLASGMTYLEAVSVVKKETGIEMTEEVAKIRVKIFNEMFSSLAMSQTNILAEKEIHPFRK